MNNNFFLIFTLLINLISIRYAHAQSDIQLMTFAIGLTDPVDINSAGDDRLFVVEQQGLIRIIDQLGNIYNEPYLNITDRVKSGGEQGLLGLAFHPDYSSNGFFFVNYTDFEDSTHIARFSVDPDDPDKAIPDSELTIMTFYQPFQNHNGGNVVFGPEGYLYFGLGDGGSGGDPGNRAQNLMKYLGKILRIDVNNGEPYSVPADNPFVENINALDEIWAYGVRNPWRFSFDRETGDLWIGDVGQNQIEEIDLQPASSSGGENYGWRCYEGSSPYNTSGCSAQSNYVFPVYEYPHSDGCSVTGGYVYRGTQIPSKQGYYFFADYCTDYIWTLHSENGNWICETVGQFSGNGFSSFGEDANSELYIAGRSCGTIYKFKDTTSGMNEKRSIRFEIFPNPFKNQLNIFTGTNVELPVSFTVRDTKGMDVHQQWLDQHESTINLNFLPAGIYFVTLEDSNHRLLTRISKM